jgi:hypothetical protein
MYLNLLLKKGDKDKKVVKKRHEDVEGQVYEGCKSPLNFNGPVVFIFTPEPIFSRFVTFVSYSQVRC